MFNQSGSACLHLCLSYDINVTRLVLGPRHLDMQLSPVAVLSLSQRTASWLSALPYSSKNCHYALAGGCQHN